MAGQQLNPRAFPPGSSQVFIDLINRLAGLLNSTSGAADEAADAAKDAQEAAGTAQQTAQQQATRNDAQDQTLEDQGNAINTQRGDLDALADVVTQDVIRNDRAQLQIMTGPLSVGTELRINNIKVLGGRITGWTASTGNIKKGGIDASQAFPVGASYNQSEVQALADALVEVRQLAAALQQALTSHGEIGA